MGQGGVSATSERSRRDAAARVEIVDADLSNLVGEQDANLRLIEDTLAVEIVPRNGVLQPSMNASLRLRSQETHAKN